MKMWQDVSLSLCSQWCVIIGASAPWWGSQEQLMIGGLIPALPSLRLCLPGLCEDHADLAGTVLGEAEELIDF